MPQPPARIVEQLKREPSRTGSIVITVFGDAIVPRGGSDPALFAGRHDGLSLGKTFRGGYVPDQMR